MFRPICLALAAAASCAAADVTGSWSGSYYAGPIYLVLKQQGAEITGTVGPSAWQQMLKLENGHIDGDRLTFKAGPLRVDLNLAGDDLTGDIIDPADTAPITLTRVEALAHRPPATTHPAKPFELATIKPNRSGTVSGVSGRGGSIRPSKGQIAMENVTLWKALGFAYGTGEDKDYAITGPPWLKSERYDILAKIPPGTTWEQMRSMLQATLTDRFKLALHRETKEMPVYAMVVARDGLKIHETEAGRGGFSFAPGRIQARSAPLAAFADRLSQMVDRPVIDQTGIAGLFDFTLEWSPDQPHTNPGDDSSSPSGPSIFTALQQQLGLRLEARRGPVEILVIESGNRIPAEN